MGPKDGRGAPSDTVTDYNHNPPTVNMLGNNLFEKEKYPNASMAYNRCDDFEFLNTPLIISLIKSGFFDEFKEGGVKGQAKTWIDKGKVGGRSLCVQNGPLSQT